MRNSNVVVALVFLFSALVAEASPRLAIPARSPGSMTGSEFLRSTAHLSEEGREQAILREIAAGNVPEFLRRLKPVRLSGRLHGKVTTATVWVLPDYLAIGTDRDFVRIPMTPITAQKLADRFDALLPTVKLVDAINQQAQTKLTPRPMPVRGAAMKTNQSYARHHALVERDLSRRGVGNLVSGHKKDIVITNRLAHRPGQVAIYGWHRPTGRPIQPLSLVHHNQYADYSHGVRLVSRHIEIDGRPYALDALLKDKKLSSLASQEGRMLLTKAPLSGKPSYNKTGRAVLTAKKARKASNWRTARYPRRG